MVFSFSSNKVRKYIRAFTLVELLVSIGIFMMMTALLVSKYGNFNSSVLLTNVAYDVALAIRQAQTYGVSVKGFQNDPNDPATFDKAYGIHLSTVASDCGVAGGSTKSSFILFADGDGDNSCDGSDISYSTYNIKKGIYVSSICDTPDLTDCSFTSADVVFKRPSPEPVLKADGVEVDYLEIYLSATDGSKRRVIVRDNGQISVDY